MTKNADSLPTTRSPITPSPGPTITPSPSTDRLVLFVAFPDMCLLDFSGPQTVFWCASRVMHARNLPGYHCATASTPGGMIRTAEGVSISTLPTSHFATLPIDTIMIPGSVGIQQVLLDSVPLIDFLRAAATNARRMTSVCNGAFLLAHTGLLAGKRAATHWLTCDLLQQNFPDILVDRDAIFTQHGSVWTSAGVTSCIDLALALVEADCGRDVAMKVARELVVFLKRPGGQSQFSQLLESQSQDTGLFDNLHAWLGQNLARQNLTVELLAEQANMSPRNFARLYKEKTGRTPAKALELFRLEAARRLLEGSAQSLKQIARSCGFRTEQRLRTTFLRNLAVTPRDYRHRFAPSFANANA